MARYIVSYEVRESQTDHRLSAFLEKIGAVRVLSSVWWVRSARTHLDLRDEIVSNVALDPHDRLLIVDIGRRLAWQRLLIDEDAARDWLDG